MLIHPGPLLALLALPLALSQGGQAGKSSVQKLSPKTFQKWSIVLPNESWREVSEKLPIAHQNGEGFLAIRRGTYLVVDTNGDGKVETEVKGAFGFVRLKAKDSQGQELNYGVRFRHVGSRWEYLPSGAMCGKLNGTKVKVIDSNGNGIYNEYGVDAIVVGRGKAASYLSKVVNLNGKLFDFEISRNGREVTLSPYQGEAGNIDLRSKFRSKGKLVSAVISNEAGDISFNVAKGSMKLPVGSYTITGGLAKKGGESAKLLAGRMEPMQVKANDKFVLAWGSPVTADFLFEVNGEEVRVKPDVHFYGKAGVEFHNWLPDAKSPKLLIKDKKTAKLLDSGRFGGC